MKKFGWRHRIGLVTPAVLEMIAFDFYRFAPEGVTLAGVTDETNTWSPEDIDRVLASAMSSAQYLGDRGVEYIVHAGAAHVASKGPGYDREFLQQLRAHGGVDATTSIRSAIEAFRQLNMQKIAVASPWPDKISGWVARYIESEGFDITSISCADVDFKNLHTVEPDYLIQYASEVAAQAPGAHGLYMPGPQAPVAMCVATIENNIGKPVVASTPTDFWAAFKALGITDRIDGHGTLLRSLSERA